MKNRLNLLRMNPKSLKSLKSPMNNYRKKKILMNSCFLSWIRYRMKKTLRDYWLIRMRNLSRFPYFSWMVPNRFPGQKELNGIVRMIRRSCFLKERFCRFPLS
jgi:hypothetical protein